jgi:lysozyme
VKLFSDDPYPEIPDGDQPGHFSLSSDGIHFIKRHEGSRRKLYNDSQGHCTIGVGHLVHKGKCDGSEPDNFRRGLTEDEVTDLLRADLAVFEQTVQKNVTSRLNQYQYDALVSFSFNVGSGAFKKSGVLNEVNAKNYSKVPDELMKWLKPPEIKGRRTDEATLFRSGKY